MKKQSIIMLCGFVILAVAATTLVGLTDLAGGLSDGGVSRFRRSGPAASLNLYDED
ncbi:Uncharacterised protein [Pantoea agglomerans]|uniref:Uncharacterized protein n=1 Tax=Enterobacter agglomerans TaxID=549 RepID=A0A379LRS1_ENTAG|nr:Uncharacterised protein [Pantoea agglomerans]